MPVCYYHVTYAFQSEFKLYSWLNVRELLARNRRDIWSLSGSNRIRTHNHLVEWVSVRLRTKWLWVRIPLLSLKLLINVKVHRFEIFVLDFRGKLFNCQLFSVHICDLGPSIKDVRVFSDIFDPLHSCPTLSIFGRPK